MLEAVRGMRYKLHRKEKGNKEKEEIWGWGEVDGGGGRRRKSA